MVTYILIGIIVLLLLMLATIIWAIRGAAKSADSILKHFWNRF